MKIRTASALALAALFASTGLHAQEAAIRQALAKRMPNFPKIDEVRPSPIAGVYEVRYNETEIIYSDAKGDFIFTGSLVDTKTRTDLTEARIEKLLAIAFDTLPFKDGLTIKQGNGSRKMAVFVDPNCGYCKRFETDLAAIKDVTIHTFLIPILGPDSTVKSRDIWCAKDPVATWRAWMLEGVVPAKADAKCDGAAIDRNLAFAQKHKINGTPGVFFTDGTRKPGALPGAQVEKLLVAAAAAQTGKKPANP